MTSKVFSIYILLKAKKQISQFVKKNLKKIK